MNRSQGNLQDAFLNVARRDNVGVTIYLISGHQLRGSIKAFDAFTVLLESSGRPPQLVYKHAIASINPVRPIRMMDDMRGEAQAAPPQPDGLTTEEEPVGELPSTAPREVEVSA